MKRLSFVICVFIYAFVATCYSCYGYSIVSTRASWFAAIRQGPRMRSSPLHRYAAATQVLAAASGSSQGLHVSHDGPVPGTRASCSHVTLSASDTRDRKGGKVLPVTKGLPGTKQKVALQLQHEHACVHRRHLRQTRATYMGLDTSHAVR